MTAKTSVLIVGAGISGLACAYALRRAKIDVQVAEESEQAGGLIRSEMRSGFLLEHGPQSLLGTAALRQLCGELGIDKELMEAPRQAARFVLVDGALRKAPLSPLAFFSSSLFGAGTKWKVLCEVLGTSQPPEQDESIAAFVRRKFSADLLEKLAGPFVSGVYAGDPEKLSMRAAFPQIYEAEKSSRSVVRGMIRQAKARNGPRERPVLLTFQEGNETLVRALAANLGAALQCRTKVTLVRKSASGGYEVRLSVAGREEIMEVRQLVLATPTNIAARLASEIDRRFEQAIGAIPYAPVAEVSLGYRKSSLGGALDGFGFLVPRSAGLEILGTVWNSSLFDGRAPEGQALLTSFVGGTTNPRAIEKSEGELANLVHGELTRILAIKEEPVFSGVSIYQKAIPQYEMGHTKRLATLEDLRRQYPGLWLTGNYFCGPSIGACVEYAFRVADEIGKGISL